MNFTECDTCAKKPGSPILCTGCLHNRRIINELRKSLDLNSSWLKAALKCTTWHWDTDQYEAAHSTWQKARQMLA